MRGRRAAHQLSRPGHHRRGRRLLELPDAVRLLRLRSLFDASELAELQLTLDDFRATYDTSQTDRIGTPPTSFEADVTVTTPPDSDTFTQTLQVNKPLNVDGTSVFLLGNGYAPEITLTDSEGTVVAEDPPSSRSPPRAIPATPRSWC